MNATEAIKLAMSHKGITQAQMAKILGLKSQTAVSERLRGQNMGTVIFQRMATVCGYDIILKDPSTGHTINLTQGGPTQTPGAEISSSTPAPESEPKPRRNGLRNMVETPEQEPLPPIDFNLDELLDS